MLTTEMEDDNKEVKKMKEESLAKHIKANHNCLLRHQKQEAGQGGSRTIRE